MVAGEMAAGVMARGCGSDSFALPMLLPSRDRLDVRNAIRARLPHSEHVQQRPPQFTIQTPPLLLLTDVI